VPAPLVLTLNIHWEHGSRSGVHLASQRGAAGQGSLSGKRRGDGPGGSSSRRVPCCGYLGGAPLPATAMDDETTKATHKPPLCSKCGRPMQLDRIVPRVLYHPGEKIYVCRPCREAVTVEE
jgi:hypothetical protein